MKQITGALVIGSALLFSGCGTSFSPTPETIKYAKKYKLTNPDYQKSEIMCVSDETLTKSERDEMFLLVSTRFYADFSINRCKKSFNTSATRSDPNAYQTELSIRAQCLNDVSYGVAESERSHFIRYSPTAYKIEFRHYHGVNELFSSKKVSTLYGYLGFEDKNNKTIVYVADATKDDIFSESKIGYIKEGVLNYMKENPTICKALDK